MPMAKPKVDMPLNKESKSNLTIRCHFQKGNYDFALEFIKTLIHKGVFFLELVKFKIYTYVTSLGLTIE